MYLFLDMTTSAATVLLVASGLVLVVTLLDVINLAHGALMACGVYGALTLQEAGLHPWEALIGGVAAAMIIGALLEFTVIRRLYTRPLDTILATFGVALVAEQVLTRIYGRAPRNLEPLVSGSWHLGPIDYSAAGILVISSAITLVIALAVVTKFTFAGLIARSVMANPELAGAAGISTQRVRQFTFIIGGGLAGFAGVLLASQAAVTPHYGFNLVVPAFLVALLAGTRLFGLIIAAAAVGAADVLFGTLFNPIYASAFVLVVAIALLRLFPDGILIRSKI